MRLSSWSRRHATGRSQLTDAKRFTANVRRNARRTRQKTSTTVQVVSSYCPYETLGVEESAGMQDIKKAYRKLALKYHPDTEGGCETNFLAVTEAYQILVGKREGKNVRRHENGEWEFHDWYWKFTMARSWSTHRKSSNATPNDTHTGPKYTTQSQVQSQLAGLRQRAAIRAVKQRAQPRQSTAHSNSGQESPSDMETNGSFNHGNGRENVDEGDCEELPVDSGTVDESKEGAQERFRRLQEEARRRSSLNGSESRNAIRAQLNGLKRRARIRGDPSL